MANRNTLSVNELPQFKEYLIRNGWKILTSKGNCDVLRATKEGRRHPLIIYRRDSINAGNPPTHLTLLDSDVRVVREFLKERNDNGQAKRC